MPKFGTKNALFGYFWDRMPCLGILALEFFKKTVVIFETSTWKFAKLSLDLQNIFSFVFYHPVFHQNVTLLQWFYAHLLSVGELSALRLWIILVMLLQHSVVLSLPKQPVNSSKKIYSHFHNILRLDILPNFSFPPKWNNARLLLRIMVCTSCIMTCQGLLS